jgi:hypothetical protein
MDFNLSKISASIVQEDKNCAQNSNKRTRNGRLPIFDNLDSIIPPFRVPFDNLSASMRIFFRKFS